MKLFKSLLVAPATLGLLAPMSATANEVTINDFNPAEELAITNSRVDGLEARLNNFEAGSFSETTTASFSVDGYLGSTDDDDDTVDDAVAAGYSFQIDLNTSFTGEDSLDISLDAGTGGTEGIAEFDGNGGGNGLTVDGVAYTFPIGDKTTAFVGADSDGSSLFTTACVYGGPSNTLDDCGNVNAAFVGSGTTLATSYDFDNGFTAALGYSGDGATTNGLMTELGSDSYGANVAYTADTYGVSVTYAMVEDAAGLDDTYTAVNGYWTPEGFPSISVGYEWGDDGSAAATADELISYFVGIETGFGPGTVGAALGTKTPTVENTTELLMYEAFYSYPINDGMSVTPLVYVKEGATGSNDETGVMVKTSFSF